jgi:hypothetical protein
MPSQCLMLSDPGPACPDRHSSPRPVASSWSIPDLLMILMSRAERAGQAQKKNNSLCPALRRCCRGEAAPSGEAALWLHWKGKVWFIVRHSPLISCPWQVETDFQNTSCVQSVLEQNTKPITSLEIGAKSICLAQNQWLAPKSGWEHLENLQVFMPAKALQSANISYAHESYLVI